MLSMANLDDKNNAERRASKYPQLSFRVSLEEKKRWDGLVALVRERARYPISETDILKTLVGFMELAHLSEGDRELLRTDAKTHGNRVADDLRAGKKARKA